MKQIAVIGGGAAGMACAVMLARRGKSVTLFERGARLGRKLAATGNGQGNVTNVNMGAEHYFSDDHEKVARALSRFGADELVCFLEGMGGIFLPDSRGRVYPCGRQASAVCDLLRRELSRLNVRVCLDAQISDIAYENGFVLGADKTETYGAVVLATGGKAAEHFGTDGSAFALAKRFGHTVTELSPALVQMRSDKAAVRGLKGIRVDGGVRVLRGGNTVFEGRGDVLFTDVGVSGDAVFRASSYAKEGDTLVLDFLPDVSMERLESSVKSADEDSLLCLVNNGLGRALIAKAGGNRKRLLSLIKNYPIPVTGTLGFAYAQVTRGGIPLSETDETLMSAKRAGLYFAGEMLNVDGECGGYNLQWAFTSAYIVAEAIQ